MDRNFLLFLALSLLILSTWSMWQGPRTPQAPQPADLAGPAGEVSPEIARIESTADAARRPGRDLHELEPLEALEPAEPGRPIEVNHSRMRVILSTRGATLQRLELLNYHVGRGGPRIALVPGEAPAELAMQTRFPELGLGDLGERNWEVDPGAPEGIVFQVQEDSITVRKIYVFDPDSYAFWLRLEVENASTRPLEPAFAVDWPVALQEGRDFAEQALAVLEDGALEQVLLAGIGRRGFFDSIMGRSAQQEWRFEEAQVEWAGTQTPYFLAALFPDDPAQAEASFSTIEPSRAGRVRVQFKPTRIPPGKKASREFRAYAGPKRAEHLEALGRGALASIDLGWSWVRPLTRFFSWLLEAIYSIIPNYGVAIVLLTVLVRLVTTPLTMHQMRSQERMRRLQPKMKALQEKHKDDREKQSQAVMEFMRREKFNPLAGCLPMVLQLPVFIGLFYALRSSFELRQAPFLWIDDLSAPDLLFEVPGLGLPIRLLPLVMGGTMVVQQKLMPMQVDPAQARMMTIVMPVVMTFVFYGFASGLVLYWMLSSVLAIAHQLWVGRKMEPVPTK